jgi:hypothetical protein
MIELKVHGHEVKLVTEDGEDFPGEVMVALHSLAGAVAKMQGISNKMAFDLMCYSAIISFDEIEENTQRTIVQIPKMKKGEGNNADD